MDNHLPNISVAKKMTKINFETGTPIFGIVQHNGVEISIDGKRFGVIPMIHSISVVDPVTGIRIFQTKMPEWFLLGFRGNEIQEDERKFLANELAIEILEKIS